MAADNVRSGAPTDEIPAVGFVPTPEDSLSETLALLLSIDVAVHDVYRGYIGPMAAVDRMRDNLPAVVRLVRSALSELTGGER